MGETTGIAPKAEVWTAERIAALEALWAEGLTAAAIGRWLGVSRNAVIGKANRLGLEPRYAAAPPLLSAVAALLPRGGCRWIEGKATPIREGMFCGRPAEAGGSWCREHRRRVYSRALSPAQQEALARLHALPRSPAQKAHFVFGRRSGPRAPAALLRGG